MAVMTTKGFIEVVFINETGTLSKTHPYIAFMIMGIGIEFLGKCLNIASFDWHEEKVSRQRFEEAVNNLNALAKYRTLIGKNSQVDLYSSLRCGLAHAAAPKYEITLSSKNEMPNLMLHEDGKRVNLRCEDFYADFKAACEEVINKNYASEDKMNQPFLSVPDYLNSASSETFITQSLNSGSPKQ